VLASVLLFAFGTTVSRFARQADRVKDAEIVAQHERNDCAFLARPLLRQQCLRELTVRPVRR
jgi:hypothetical protein